jgi:hypothetical protein
MRFLLTVAWVGLLATPCRAAPPPLHGVGIDEMLGGTAVLAEALNQAMMRAHGLPLYARIVVAPRELDTNGEPGPRFERLDERVERYTAKGVAVILALPGPFPAPQASDGWRRLLRDIAGRYRGRIKAYEIGDVSGVAAPDVHDYAFGLKIAAVELRAADPEALIVQGDLRPQDLAWQTALYAEDVAPYIDAVAVSGRDDELVRVIPAFEKLLAQENGSASLVITGFSLSDDPSTAARDLLDWQLSRLGGKAVLTTYAVSQAAAAAALPAVERLKDLLTADLVLLDDQSVALKLKAGGQAVGGTLLHSLLTSLDDLGLYLVLRGRAPIEGTLEIEVDDPAGRSPRLRDALKGSRAALRGASWDATVHLTRVSVPLSDHPLIVDFPYGQTAYLAHTEVREEALPLVGEIVSRHQVAQAAQDALWETYVASALVESLFHLSATTTYDVVTENRYYSDKEGSEWEELSFSLNGTRWKEKRPAVLVPQAEKVLSRPLDLRLTQDYRYRLERVETVNDHRCYAVRFEPVSGTQSLYRGTVWIDAKTFAKVKIQAVQTHLGSPVVSNEEIQDFTPAAMVGEQPLYLLSHFTSRQIMLIGGRNLLVERIVRFSDFEVNSPSFSERREASRAGNNIMMRDTDEGLRNLVKNGDRRVIEENPATAFKALAVGVLVDPSFDFPLPILGFNYLNFHFLKKDTQVALFFAGFLAVGSVQRPKVIGDSVDASLDLFAIAVRGHNEVFGAGGAVRSEWLRTRPFSTRLSLGWQVTPFQKLTGSYRFRFDSYKRDAGTALNFVTPVDTVTNGFGLNYAYRRGGYSFVADAAYYRRGSWRSWGYGEGFSPGHRRYRKVSLSLSKDFSIQTFQKIHLNVAYFGGYRLDRFSMYAFNQFDQNRIHGVPSSGVRFSDLGVFRAGYSFNVFNLYGLDLFYDQAIGRGRAVDDKWSRITGVGLGLNLKAPLRTLLRGEIGKSFLPRRYSTSGTVVAQVVLLRPL